MKGSVCRSAGLEPSEALEIDRRRAKLTQAQAAALYGVGLTTFRAWAAGERTHDVPVVPVEPLAVHEWCWLQRRRSGLRLVDVSAEIGLGVRWVHKAERGAIPLRSLGPLETFWRRRVVA